MVTNARSRSILPLELLPEFKQWLMKKGWEFPNVHPQGVLLHCKKWRKTEVGTYLDIISVTKRSTAKQHATTSGLALEEAIAFLAERKRRRV